MNRVSAAEGLVSRVLGLFRPYRRRVLLLVLVIVASGLIGITTPLLTKVIFDRALFPPDGSPRLRLLTLLVGLMVIAVASAGALAIGQTYLSTTIGQRVMHDVRGRLFEHLNRLSLRFFTDARTGEIQSRITQDVEQLAPVVVDAGPSVLANGVFVLASVVAMLILSWPLTLASLVVLPCFAYFSHRIGQRRRSLLSQRQERLTEMSVLAEETLSVSGMLLTRVFDRHRQTVDRYREESRVLTELTVKQQMAGRVLLGLAQSFVLMGPAVVYLVAGYTASSHPISPGTVVAFAALQIRLFTPILQLMDRWAHIHASLALFERIFHYLDLPDEIADAPHARSLDPRTVRGEIAFRDVSFRYGGSADPALDHVRFRIAPGQLAAIVGPTGAGKTTVTYLVARLYDVTDGAVEIDGIDVRDLELSSLTGSIGMVTQETTLFHASVRENLLYGKPDASDAELESAASAALVHDRILELEDGYDTLVGERGYRLSGGERQRLGIARVLLKNPPILVLDEATSALDVESERLVQRALQRLTAGRTTIAIAHRLSTVRGADVIFVLDRGRLVEEGRHAELVARGGLYTRLYGQQSLAADSSAGAPADASSD